MTVRPSINGILDECGLTQLRTVHDPRNPASGEFMQAVGDFLRGVAQKLKGEDSIFITTARTTVISHFEKFGIKSPARLVDVTLDPLLGQAKARESEQSPRREEAEAASEGAITFPDPEPWKEAVDPAVLLQEVKDWIGGYVDTSDDALVAITVWVASTWFVERAYIAPILALLSPTKRSGKTLILDLLRRICCKAYLSSPVGVTPAVIFRRNDQHRPTLLIDEAECLSGRYGNRDLISLLNQGYRKGSIISRCREPNSDGTRDLEDFDAFGFRAVAAIGNLWDTILDRSVVIRLQRKPRDVDKRRYNGREADAEGIELAQKLHKFSQDYLELLEEFMLNTPRPKWLNDRACDNWEIKFAVASFAGNEWLNRAQEAAKSLSRAGEDLDWYERLVHDTHKIFKGKGNPDVIKSGDLAAYLNEIETSPWGDYRGKGLTPHSLAKRFEPFKIKPHQNRSSDGSNVRGYWLKDLQPVFRGYPPPSKPVQVGQPNNDGSFNPSESGTKMESSTTSKPAQTLAVPGMYQLSHSEGYQEKGNPKDSQRSYDRKELGLSPIVVDLIDSMKRADVSAWLDGNGELQIKGKPNQNLRQNILAHTLVLTSLIKSGDLVRLTAKLYWEEK